jgi:ComF family protein
MRFASLLLDLFFPADCRICKEMLGCNENYICKDCFDKIEPLKPPLCVRCGKHIDGGIICLSCKSRRIYFERARSYGEFSGVLKESIHLLKYEKKLILVDKLANLMDGVIDGFESEFHYLLGVPIHKNKERKRGFNQTELFCDFLSKTRGIPVLPGLAKKIDTPHQVGLDHAARMQNVKDSFRWRGNKRQIEGKRLLLVDDVMTTGSTVNECSKILMAEGAESVCILTLASA